MFAVLHLADFALHAVLRTEHESRGRPAALFSGTGRKSLVLAANPAARTAGVERGMTAPQAVARCPALLIRAPNATMEAEARATVLTLAFMLSPAVEDTAPGVCTIDLRGATREKYLPAARMVIMALAESDLPATAGLARTPLLALYAARTADPVLEVVDEGDFLAPLPLAMADPSPELASVLADWGLRTLGDLTALPRDEIVRRFGAEGLALWQRASGGDPRPLRPVTLPQNFSAAMDFESEIETLEPLLFILRRFLDRLTLELSAAQFVAAELELTLRLEDDTRYPRSFRLPEPTADAGILFRVLHTHLDSLTATAAISAVELRLIPTRPLVRQQGIFESGLRDPHGFAETLAQVVALVGPDRVGTPRLEDTHRPDAVNLIPPPAVIPPPLPPPLHPPLGLPLRRFRPPLAARVKLNPDHSLQVWTERVEGKVSFCSPALHSDGNWWQSDRAWSRHEWDIALDGGGLYRLLLADNAFFIEGEYD